MGARGGPEQGAVQRAVSCGGTQGEGLVCGRGGSGRGGREGGRD